MATALVQHPSETEPRPEDFDRELNPASDGGNDGRAVTLGQYLNTAYYPDCDYIDGHLEERNLDELDHSDIQTQLAFLLRARTKEWQIQTFAELRLQVSPTNFRVPDIMVLRAGHKADRIVREAPLLCIEVLSPGDTFHRLANRVRDYLNLGVENIWAFDPETKEAFLCDREGFHKVLTAEVSVPGTAIRLALAEIFPPTETPPPHRRCSFYL